MPVHERAWLRMYRSDAKVSQNGRCKYCCAPLKPKQATGDHVKAVIWGGEVNRENIVAACMSCNLLKGKHGTESIPAHDQESEERRRLSRLGCMVAAADMEQGASSVRAY